MERLFSLLLFAAAFYVMMRFGCGAHMGRGHGGHGRREEPDHTGHASASGSETVDPVCGMSVTAGKGYTETIGARTYRFCSRACLDRFDANPRQYAA